MTSLFKQLEIVLLASNIHPELEAELIIVNQNQQCWRFYCNPTLRLEEIKIENLNRFNCCKLDMTEEIFLSILNNSISAQDALEQNLIKVEGKLSDILRSNAIIDSLRGQAFVANLS